MLILVLAVVACTFANGQVYIKDEDKARFTQLFESSGLGKDVESSYYSFAGLKALGSAFTDAQAGCNYLKENVDASSPESIFFAASAAASLKGCTLDTGALKSTLDAAIKDGSTSKQLYYAVGGLKALGQKVTVAPAQAALTAAVKEDGAALSHAYSFATAAILGGDVKSFADNIEDAIAQADEVEGTLRLESGVAATAFLIDSIYKLAQANRKSPAALTEDKLVMFTSYLLARSQVHSLRGAFYVINALNRLSTNPYHVPVVVSLSSPIAVSSEQPMVQVRVTDVMGNSLSGCSVTADTTKHLTDQAVIISKKALSAVSGQSAVFEMNLMESKPRHGFYQISLSVTPPKKGEKYVGLSNNEVAVKVVVPVSVASFEVGVADRDQATVAKSTKLQHPGKAANALEADHHQKIVMKFSLTNDVTGDKITAHQTFVRFETQKTKEEVIFTAELDADTYKFELDLGKEANKFAQRSGSYKVELMIGDAVIQNPFVWHLADAKLSFAGSAPDDLDHSARYKKKKEISHLFREAETRPPAIISTLFSALVVLPALVMLFMWLKIGVNINNFQFSLYCIGFHVCLAAIFGLYYCYWIQLDMFQTVRYLVLLGIPTFICGNRMLASMAQNGKKA